MYPALNNFINSYMGIIGNISFALRKMGNRIFKLVSSSPTPQKTLVSFPLQELLLGYVTGATHMANSKKKNP